MKITKSTLAAQCCGITSTAILLIQALAAEAAVPWATVYATDFATDPGWTTSDPGAYHWNPGGNYTLTMADASESYATTPISLTPHTSFRFEFDVMITRMDWAGDISIGLFGATRDSDPRSGTHPFLKIGFGNGDLGYGIEVGGFDVSNTYRSMGQYPSSYALNVLYHAAITYDHDAGTLAVLVRRQSDGYVIWSDSISCIQDFADVLYFGASKVGDDYAPGATGGAVVDNVSLSQPAWVLVYASEFLTDPGWSTSDPSAYHWNPGGNYTLTMADASESYAMTPILLTPHTSFKFDFDLSISQMDWAGDISVGLFGATRDSDPRSGTHPFLKIGFGNGDLGYGIEVGGFDASNTYRSMGQYPSSYMLNTPYHATVTYDHDAGTLAVLVRRQSDCGLIWSNSMSGVQDFADLIYFGASKVGDDYAPGATGTATIDNVGLYESAPAASIRHSQVEICWPSRSNATYNVQYASALTTNFWVNLFTNINGGAGQTCVQDAITVGQPQRFYRVQIAK